MILGHSQVRRVLDEVARLARQHESQREALARSERASRARWEVLLAVGEGRTVPQIARQMGVARQSVQRVADGLAESGLVRFDSNPGHRRSPIVRATEEGSRLLDRLGRRARGWEQSVEDLVEPEDLETALVVLRAIRSALDR
jgi:DNA-binding MarR family transcriptional regulator